MKDSVLRTRSYELAIIIVKLAQLLQKEEKEFVLSRQLLRSGTSIGANIREAEFAQSKADFIHKMSISLKEANETIYWIDLLKDTNYIDIKTHEDIFNKCDEILRMLIATVKTMKKKKS